MFFKRQKRSFLLLEIMIAFTLLFCFLFPFLRTPFSLYHHEKTRLKRLEYERIANLSFAEILTKLYQKKIPWKDLSIRNQKVAKDFFLPLYAVTPSETVQRTYQLIRRNRKIGPDNTEYIKVEILLSLRSSIKEEKEVFSHFVLLQKKLDTPISI